MALCKDIMPAFSLREWRRSQEPPTRKARSNFLRELVLMLSI
jgi:hypothetical protein